MNQEKELAALTKIKERIETSTPFYILISDEEGREIEELSLAAHPELLKAAIDGIKSMLTNQMWAISASTDEI